MRIDFLSETDIPRLIELERDFNDGWSENQLKSAFSSGRFYVLGAIEDGKTVGFISFSVSIDTCDIETVLIKKEFRRKGYAGALIDFAERVMQEKGVKEVFLEVRQTNESAKALYFKKGYKKISIRKNYYSDLENAEVLKKEI